MQRSLHRAKHNDNPQPLTFYARACNARRSAVDAAHQSVCARAQNIAACLFLHALPRAAPAREHRTHQSRTSLLPLILLLPLAAPLQPPLQLQLLLHFLRHKRAPIRMPDCRRGRVVAGGGK